MPFLQVHVARDVAPEVKRQLGKALAAAYGEVMQTSRLIVSVGFVRYPEGDLARYDARDDEAREMAVVTCDVRAGRPPEQLEALGRTCTELCARALGLPDTRVAVYITPHEGFEIYRDGGRAPDWSPAEGGPG